DELLYNLHPTPAVGGWPKKEALAYIEDHEKHDRAYYSGYFGLRTKDSFAYYVNLRCMQVYNNAVVLYAGGGILADSDPVSEWEETEAKLQTLLRVIQSTNLYE
ncbi:MAG: chorismate-binding protein, partial [Owenweeksia sp.]